MKWTNKGHEFDLFSEIIVSAASNKKCYIWGAGYFGDAAYNTLSKHINIIGYIDSNPKKQGKNLNGLQIMPPSVLGEINSSNVYVLVSAGWTKDIFNSLETMGYYKGENAFHTDEFISIFMMYRYEFLYIPNISIFITEKCTLRCKFCSSMNPHIKDPQNISIEQIANDLDILFKTVDHVSSLLLCGGDAMCNPQCTDIIKFIGTKYYKAKIGTIELYTNGVLIPDTKLLNALKEYNVYFRFTDYKLPGKQKSDEIIRLLNDYQIKYDIASFDTWYDIGYPQETNGIFGEDSLQNHFESCDRRSCQLLFDGKFYFCALVQAANRIGYCTAEAGDYFNLNDYTGNRKDFLEFVLGYSEKGYSSLCKKCNGGFNINTHRIPAGLQM